MRVQGATFQKFLLGTALLSALVWNLAQAGEINGLQLGAGATGTRAEIALVGTADYTLPQQWSSALHAHPQDVDGFLYRSRLINDSLAVVLFKRVQRGARKMRVADSVALCAHINFLATMAQLRVK